MEEHKIEKTWKPYETEGEQFVSECAVCGKTIFGKEYSSKYLHENRFYSSTHPLDRVKGTGIFCNNCGYTVCWGIVNQHVKELKPYGFGKVLGGTCPGCGKSFIKDATHRNVVKSRLDLVSEKGRCMTCGKKEPLQTVSMWSGVRVEEDQNSVEGDENSKYMRNMFLGIALSTIISAHKATKVIEVKNNEYEVCESCSAAKKPEEHTKISRSIQKQLPYEIQRKPFTEAGLEDKAN